MANMAWTEFFRNSAYAKVVVKWLDYATDVLQKHEMMQSNEKGCYGSGYENAIYGERRDKALDAQ